MTHRDGVTIHVLTELCYGYCQLEELYRHVSIQVYKYTIGRGFTGSINALCNDGRTLR